MHEFEEYLKRLASELNVSPRRAEEICAELRSHLEATAEQLQQSGLSREEALAEATRIFGEPRAIGQQLRRIAMKQKEKSTCTLEEAANRLRRVADELAQGHAAIGEYDCAFSEPVMLKIGCKGEAGKGSLKIKVRWQAQQAESKRV
jgi:amphi-Trp domain-containing protein